MKKALMLSTLFCFIAVNSADHFRVLRQVSNHIPKNPVIFEAGAHVGEDTERMSQFWPEGSIYAFEPSPPSFEKLVEKTKNLHNVTRYNLALSDYIGETSFYMCTDNPGASSTLPPADWFTLYKFIKTPITVACSTINEWATLSNIKHVDFMWLDMEGNELKALQHASKILNTVKVIYIELNNKEFRTGTPHYNTVRRWLEEQGFVSHGETRAYHKGDWWQSDVLFVRQR